MTDPVECGTGWLVLTIAFAIVAVLWGVALVAFVILESR